MNKFESYSILYYSVTINMRIAISGKARSGKDTCAEYLTAFGSFTKIAFSEPLYDVTMCTQILLNAPVKKDPDMLQAFGEFLRNHYPGIFINILEAKIFKCTDVIVTDLRYKDEMAMLKMYGFKFIRINKIQRDIDRDEDHLSEVDLDDATFDYVIDNNGTQYEFQKKVFDVYQKILQLNL